MSSPISPSEELRKLVALIGHAAQTAEKHLLDPKLPGREQTTDTELRTSIAIIQAACAQLCSLVARPSDTLTNKFMAFFESACLQVALSNKIPDILQDSPSGVHISELGRKTGVDQGKLGRIMRLLATKHVFREVDADTFSNNHLSEHLVSTNPLSSFGLHITDECLKAASVLSDTLNDPRLTTSTSPRDSAFSKCFDETFFDHLAGSSPDQVKRAARFGLGMIGWGAAIEADSVVYDFPWLEKGSVVCDVGGGVGNISMQLAKRYPTLQIILQDTPEQLDAAKNKIWPQHCREAITERRIEFVPLDFFKEPPKHGCDIYFLKNILHDWNDEDCAKILRSVRKAMTPDSKVLVHEFIVQPAHRVPIEEAKFTQAPEPLLPNYGVARIRQYALDIDMMAVLNSHERTLKDFIQLGNTAGLKFVKLWQMGEMGLIEFARCDEDEFFLHGAGDFKL